MSAQEYRELMGRGSHKDEIEKARELFTVLKDSYLYITSQGHRLRGSAGIPDCYVMYKGRAVWWECKVGKDKLRESQEVFIERLKDTNAEIVVGSLGDLVDFLGISGD
jgi:hypothetical protein